MPTPGPNLKFGLPLFLVIFAIAGLALYGGAKLVEPAPTEALVEEGPPPGGPLITTVVARNSQFDKRSLVASAGMPVTVTLDNQDAGVLHNIAFYTNRQATTQIAVGDVFPGIESRDLNFTAPGATGDFFFRCDVHPEMQGTFSVR